MRLVLDMSLDNAAFETPDGLRRDGDAVAVVLRHIADRLTVWPLYVGAVNTVRDSNGNRIGKVEITDD